MKVRITKCSGLFYWYADKIGQEFEVEDYTHDRWRGVNTFGGIDKTDCEIVPEEADELAQIRAAFSANAEDFDKQMTRLLMLAAKLLNQNAELQAQIKQEPKLPHWRESINAGE